MDGLPESYCVIVEDCIERNMTKEETERYAHEIYEIPPQDTNRVWNHLESTNPDMFIAYNARMREREARIPPRVAQPSEVTSERRDIPSARGQQAQRRPRAPRPLWNSPNYQRELVLAVAASPREGTSAAIVGEQEEEQRLSPPPSPPARRSLWTDVNVQRFRAASPQVLQEAANANALENQGLQASQQQPAYPNDFWQQILNTLNQIQSNTQHLGQIQSNTDQMVKLLTDRHGSGPHPFAAGSSKRQRVGEAEERGGDGETEKLQEKDEGEDEELQEKEKGNDEEVQKNDGGDNA